MGISNSICCNIQRMITYQNTNKNKKKQKKKQNNKSPLHFYENTHIRYVYPSQITSSSTIFVNKFISL